MQILSNPIYCLKCSPTAKMFASHRKSESRNTMVMSDLRVVVEIWPFYVCAIPLAIIIETVRSL